MILQRYNGSKVIKELEFRVYAFWVQIHYLPFKFMIPKTAEFIDETIGPIIKSNDPMEMK